MTVRWINVYKRFTSAGVTYGSAHYSRDDADFCASGHRLYCIRVTLK